MNINYCIIGGNLVRDPEIREVGAKNARVCGFTVAVNRRWKDASGALQEATSFIRCDAWMKTADLIFEHFHKGMPIVVEGEIEQQTFTDKEGVKKEKTHLRVANFHFVGSKDGRAAPAADAAAASAAAPIDDDVF